MTRASWTAGTSVETTLELWASSLREVKGRMRSLFSQERVAASAETFLDGLLGAELRKTGWMRAEAAGDAGPWRQQAVLGRGRWDADALYRVGDIDMALRRAGKGCVLGVKNHPAFNAWVGKPEVAGTAKTIANGLAQSARMRLSAGDGTKGARLYDWAYCELADLDGADNDQTGVWTRGLLIRRSLSDGERSYFTTWCPAGTPLATLVTLEGRRWCIEDAFETANMNSGSLITRPASGMAGIGTSAW